MTAHWTPVSKANPCPICGKPDWCMIGAQFVLCNRIESPKPCKMGWLHAIGDTTKLRPLPPKPEKPVTIDAARIMRGFAGNWQAMQETFAASLGVALDALKALGCAWSVGHRAWAFPMKDWRGNIIGIRLRSPDGHKWAVKGSKAGLFYAEGVARLVAIVEGPTDAAAGLTIGMETVGRPSCLGCERETDRLLRRKKANRAIIVSDNDDPGYRGAEKLQEALSVPSIVFCPPGKDLRSSVQAGLTAELVDSLTHSLVWTQPQPKTQ